MAESQPPTFRSGPLHPTDELLAAYVTGSLNSDEERGINTHMQGCDVCLETVHWASRRIAAASEVAVPVPVALRRRVDLPASGRRWWSGLADRLSTVTRLPMLIPMAVAAGAILVLTAQNVLIPASPRELTRSVPMRQDLRVTAAEAPVRTQPNSHANVVATLTRGTRVEVRGEEREWYRVSLPEGSEGWIERHAFE